MIFNFSWQYVIPVGIFIFCYGRIIHTIRRQSKVISGHGGRSGNTTTATTSRDQNTGQPATGTKLSRTELNVIQTMVIVVVCFVIFWSATSLQLVGVCLHQYNLITINLAIAKRPCDCCIILKSGSYTKAI